VYRKGRFDSPFYQPWFNEVGTRSLADLARDPRANFFSWTGPVQTIYLSGMLPPYMHHLTGFDVIRDPSVIDLALKHSLENLDNLAWIGSTGSLTRDLETLAAYLHVAPLPTVFRRNDTQPGVRLRQGDVDEATLELLKQRLEPDRILFDRAEELAKQRHDEAIDFIRSGRTIRGVVRL
jgi:hypothetical protein